MIIWGPELTMMLQVIGALQCHIARMVQGSYSKFVNIFSYEYTGVCTRFHFPPSSVDCSLVGPARMANHTWWNGMRAKVL